jgi:hypothetical protein
MQKHTTTSGKNKMFKLLFKSNFLKLFFKIPNEFSTTFLAKQSCLFYIKRAFGLIDMDSHDINGAMNRW